MIIVIAPDSFKECLGAVEVARAIARGWLLAEPGAELRLVPVADGGEGTVETLAATFGRLIDTVVCGPLGDPVTARWALLENGTAVIEMTACSGLHLVKPAYRDPTRTTTRGVGELIRAALDEGARRFIIGVGGSATNDGGSGMARALGVTFRDAAGRELAPGGGALANLAEIDATGLDPRIKYCEFYVACDVDNPLCGPEGASHVYGPQKGATPEQVDALDSALTLYAAAVKAAIGTDIRKVPGAGAAGGLAAGLMAFLSAALKPGFELIAEQVGLAKAMQGADLVITGEGSLDGQSIRGKAPIGVARMAKERNIPCIALAGRLGPGYQLVYEHGITAAFAIAPGPATRKESITHAGDWLADRAEAIARLWLTARGWDRQ